MTASSSSRPRRRALVGRARQLRLIGEVFLYLALASLWNLLAGYAGLVSVGQQAYVGLGGYILFALAMFAGVHRSLASSRRGRRLPWSRCRSLR